MSLRFVRPAHVLPQKALKFRFEGRERSYKWSVSGLDWGTVPAWFSAIGTSGSLLLGFFILLRDRRKEERQEAQKVVTHFHGDAEENAIRVHLLNTADRPVLYPEVVTTGPEEQLFESVRVDAGEEVDVLVPRYAGGVRNRPIAVRFFDADGYQWVRDLRSGDVFRRKRLRRGDPNVRLLLRPHFWTQWLAYLLQRRRLRR